jgi:hypothetical protein
MRARLLTGLCDWLLALLKSLSYLFRLTSSCVIVTLCILVAAVFPPCEMADVLVSLHCWAVRGEPSWHDRDQHDSQGFPRDILARYDGM